MKIKILMPLLLIFVLLVGLILLRPGEAETFEVVLSGDGFQPSELTVPQDSQIVFRTETGEPFWPASDPHPLHDNYSVFDSEKPINSNETWTFKAGKVGEWGFHDHLFFTRRGKLIVVSKKDWEKRKRVLNREEILQKINKEGINNAYASLKEVSDPLDVSTHSTFHIFGETLYEKEGTPGIGYCDEFAGFACYHGFFIKAVSDRGIEVAEELDEECVKEFGINGLGCPHGIGHGLIEFLGYEKINEALDICSKLTWQGEFFGCQGGVFMENNFRTVFAQDGSEVVTREAHGNLYEPCRSVPLRFRKACYFEQASWWKSIFDSDYEKVGEFCEGIPEVGEKEACFLGTGNAVAEISAFDNETVIKSCSLMPNDFSVATCRAGGAWAFFANPDKESLSESLCQGLGNYEDLCLEKRILVD